MSMHYTVESSNAWGQTLFAVSKAQHTLRRKHCKRFPTFSEAQALAEALNAPFTDGRTPYSVETYPNREPFDPFQTDIFVEDAPALNPPPYPWCGQPAICCTKGYCLRNPSCGD